MYAAFQLRHAVNDLAGALDPNLSIPDFFNKVRATFDPQIKNAVKLLTDRASSGSEIRNNFHSDARR